VSTAEIETLHSKIGQLVVAWDFLADALAQWLNGSMAQWLNTAERAAKNGAQGS
jgi:hypothetical protein|tara:strand:+ start:3678 stop:3839 length:162 start_codon:yes stop_codon:yes gene_type:complete